MERLGKLYLIHTTKCQDEKAYESSPPHKNIILLVKKNKKSKLQNGYPSSKILASFQYLH